MIILYSTDTCPKCAILKEKMFAKKIKFEECKDQQKMRDLTITQVPYLQVNGELLDFSAANKYINSL